MAYTTLIRPAELAVELGNPQWVVFDTRFDLMQPVVGRQKYEAGHLPCAYYLDLNEDLAAPISPTSGRHPLPDVGVFAGLLRAYGVGQDTQVVVYDDSHGVIAARLWWMLRWLGHSRVAVLEGGIQAWQQAGYALTVEVVPPVAGDFEAKPDDSVWVDTAAVATHLARGEVLIDSRSPERYRGEQEPIDGCAGHVPDAVNIPTMGNVDGQGCFLSPELLRARFSPFVKEGESALVMCGSGVSACHNLLAMELAGFRGAKLYVGSWSEWIRDPQRPIVSVSR